MQSRPFGQTGLQVGAVGFGAWQLNNPLWGGPDRAESVRLVHAALAAGCNFFDTAPGYGDGASETLLGEALRGRRDAAVVCTKFGHSPDGTEDFSVAALRPSLTDSLRRLQTDHVDLLLLHNPPSERLEGTKAADLYAELSVLQREGKIRWFGASLDTGRELRVLAETTPSRAAEVLFNAFHQEPASAFAGAAQRGLGLIAKVPLDSGWLSGKYNEQSRFEGIRARWTPADIARRAALTARLRALLPTGRSLAQAALGFVLAQPQIATVIPGVKTHAQLEANLSAAQAPLPPEFVAAIAVVYARDIAGRPLPW